MLLVIFLQIGQMDTQLVKASQLKATHSYDVIPGCCCFSACLCCSLSLLWRRCHSVNVNMAAARFPSRVLGTEIILFIYNVCVLLFFFNCRCHSLALLISSVSWVTSDAFDPVCTHSSQGIAWVHLALRLHSIHPSVACIFLFLLILPCNGLYPHRVFQHLNLLCYAFQSSSNFSQGQKSLLYGSGHFSNGDHSKFVSLLTLISSAYEM